METREKKQCLVLFIIVAVFGLGALFKSVSLWKGLFFGASVLLSLAATVYTRKDKKMSSVSLVIGVLCAFSLVKWYTLRQEVLYTIDRHVEIQSILGNDEMSTEEKREQVQRVLNDFENR